MCSWWEHIPWKHLDFLRNLNSTIYINSQGLCHHHIAIISYLNSQVIFTIRRSSTDRNLLIIKIIIFFKVFLISMLSVHCYLWWKYLLNLLDTLPPVKWITHEAFSWITASSWLWRTTEGRWQYSVVKICPPKRTFG